MDDEFSHSRTSIQPHVLGLNSDAAFIQIKERFQGIEHRPVEMSMRVSISASSGRR